LLTVRTFTKQQRMGTSLESRKHSKVDHFSIRPGKIVTDMYCFATMREIGAAYTKNRNFAHSKVTEQFSAHRGNLYH